MHSCQSKGALGRCPPITLELQTAPYPASNPGNHFAAAATNNGCAQPLLNIDSASYTLSVSYSQLTTTSSQQETKVMDDYILFKAIAIPCHLFNEKLHTK